MTDYITSSNFKTRHGITTSTDDARIAAHITAASLEVDSITGRQFGTHTGAATDRYFVPDGYRTVRIDDCYEITTVATDEDDSGSYATTWTVSTDYQVVPLNGVGPNGQTGWPVTQLLAVGYTKSFPTCTRRPSVKVTGKWGWAVVPTDVIEATYLLAHRLFYERDVPSGVVPGSVEFGGVGMRRPWTVERLLAPYIRADRKLGITG
ncbi:MAG TPA: hypothetical protein VGK49_08755 [Ilumatobacteraceae bacterium]